MLRTSVGLLLTDMCEKFLLCLFIGLTLSSYHNQVHMDDPWCEAWILYDQGLADLVP